MDMGMANQIKAAMRKPRTPCSGFAAMRLCQAAIERGEYRKSATRLIKVAHYEQR
ncbi:hypothetical protein DPMN_048259 [Dreissena polymorpha]|uniref:Uncharacterized protein n=1 Tax=Dreissena polymorpha TaxID=45954 RepID=A0A9D4I271_DREPO|nr:hypothetical protein DPMN_048259 [Dreissena polymorpha]